MNIIQLKNISKSYFSGETKTPVLFDISLSIPQGQFIAIMGPSGAGKSTLLHILGLLDKQTTGSYLFEEQNIDAHTQDELSHIRNQDLGFVFQAFNLLPRTSVLENVKLPLMYSKVPMKEWNSRALEAIKAVGLSHRLTHDPSQLSGGEKQRVAIARSLVCEPKVIFADEPTGNLDTKSGNAIMKILNGLHQQGHTIVLITHEKEIALHAERIIHIVDGRIDKDYETNSNVKIKGKNKP
jgi:putative ABC transport system ATP-binding protein